VDVTLPYKDQGNNAFSGRTLDEKVVNPFLQANQIPCSKGPYLSVFRRSVRFNSHTRQGLRDKEGYDALLRLLRFVKKSSAVELTTFEAALMGKFIALREKSGVSLVRLQRMSLEQYNQLMTGLLGVPSGGRFPLMLVAAAFRALAIHLALGWQVSVEGINVADKATGAAGDITVIKDGTTVLVAEVTEREVDKAKLEAIFTTKIAPHSIDDYMIVSPSAPSTEVTALARLYFAQGHEVAFLLIKDWILAVLSLLGQKGRTRFTTEFLNMLEGGDVPVALKQAWNTQVQCMVST
jgi:hypothetical protein